MSTRAAIIVKDNKVKNNLYRHCDGYPDGLGEELKEFLEKYDGNINPDSIANGIERKGIAEHTGWIHSDEDYLYIIDCDTRKLTCYYVSFSWEYHKKFTRADGKTDYCAWRDHIDIDNIEDPIIKFEYPFANSTPTNQSDYSQPATVNAQPTMKLCDYRHAQIKEGAKLQVQMLEHMGMTRQFSLRKLFMFGCDYAFSFIERISDHNPEEFSELLNEDNTTKFIVAYQKNENEFNSTPLWTRRIFKEGRWQWDSPSATDIIEWMPVCNHISISRPDDER